ncbi:MAG: double zinc ribbon domain-containing protein [Gammaproteobacteria bacterium]
MNALHRLQTFLLPSVCLLCNNATRQSLPLCHFCEKSLPFLPQGCRYCGLPLPESVTNPVCGQCLNLSHPYDNLHVIFNYVYPLPFLIAGLKFAQQWFNAPTLGTVMAYQLEKRYHNVFKPQAIIPMPLHKERLRQRGYNQSLELARPISKHLAIPLLKQATKRIKSTLPQTEVSLSKRLSNVKNAFVYPHRLPPYIAVIDDVFTTGHTLRSFCAGLKAHGVKRIDAWICARTPQKNIKT